MHKKERDQTHIIKLSTGYIHFELCTLRIEKKEKQRQNNMKHLILEYYFYKPKDIDNKQNMNEFFKENADFLILYTTNKNNIMLMKNVIKINKEKSTSIFHFVQYFVQLASKLYPTGKCSFEGMLARKRNK